MAIAYANSQRSPCLKRKVGAVVVDGQGQIISSGYNDVPGDPANSCRSVYGACYRDIQKNQVGEKVRQQGLEGEQANALMSMLWSELKVLDRCRSLHAEEQAILNLAKFGSRVPDGATSTSRPIHAIFARTRCVEVGIRRLVYFEPYSVKESATILAGGNVVQVPFCGIVFNGYFRLFGGNS